MNVVLHHKFTQHEDLKRELLATGNAELIEVRKPWQLTFFRTHKTYEQL